jgi:hypothetical protein
MKGQALKRKMPTAFDNQKQSAFCGYVLFCAYILPRRRDSFIGYIHKERDNRFKLIAIICGICAVENSVCGVYEFILVQVFHLPCA